MPVDLCVSQVKWCFIVSLTDRLRSDCRTHLRLSAFIIDLSPLPLLRFLDSWSFTEGLSGPEQPCHSFSYVKRQIVPVGMCWVRCRNVNRSPEYKTHLLIFMSSQTHMTSFLQLNTNQFMLKCWHVIFLHKTSVIHSNFKLFSHLKASIIKYNLIGSVLSWQFFMIFLHNISEIWNDQK